MGGKAAQKWTQCKRCSNWEWNNKLAALNFQCRCGAHFSRKGLKDSEGGHAQGRGAAAAAGLTQALESVSSHLASMQLAPEVTQKLSQVMTEVTMATQSTEPKSRAVR
eukprot:5812843-Pyramimonas_sp.AAC.1